ncbi:MAG: ketoacyl-ACP synthase III [Caldisericia bacterium]|nr:ketoacyl-ACP synthase III [Caldisericia bacterium]MDD4614927.1 ketoacyl-ACP synthase III [Caldisericia bacterium]
MKKVRIRGVGHYAPERVVTNEYLATIVDTNDEWIQTRTGIQSRRFVAPDQTTSDMAAEAARMAMKQAGIQPDDIDLVVVGTSSPDMLYPSTACVVCDKLQLKSPTAFDLQAGCSGFVYGLTTATQFLRTGLKKNALVIGADAISRFIDFSDRTTCVLFGDAAGAMLLSSTEEGSDQVLCSIDGTDGSGGKYLSMPAGGAQKPASIYTLQNHEHSVHMNGKEIFKFAVRISIYMIENMLQQTGLTIDDIDHFVFHQANVRIIDAAVNRMGFSKEKVIYTLHEYGNTSSASIPFTLSLANQNGTIKENDIVLMVVFGAGLTYAGSIVRW